MKFAYGVFALTLLALSINSTKGFLLDPILGAVTDQAESLLALKDLLVTIFEKDGTVPSDSSLHILGNMHCVMNDKLRTAKIYAEASKGIFKCVGLPFEQFFNPRAWRRFRLHLRRDIRRCKQQTDDVISYLECTTDVIIDHMKELEIASEIINAEFRSCILSVLLDVHEELEESNESLQSCLDGDTTTKRPRVPTTAKSTSTSHSSVKSSTVSPMATTTVQNKVRSTSAHTTTPNSPKETTTTASTTPMSTKNTELSSSSEEQLSTTTEVTAVENETTP